MTISILNKQSLLRGTRKKQGSPTFIQKQEGKGKPKPVSFVSSFNFVYSSFIIQIDIVRIKMPTNIT